MEEIRPQSSRRRWLWIALLITGVGFACCALIVGGVGIAALTGRLPGVSQGFDQARWQQGNGCDPNNPRLGMYEELRTKLLAERPTRPEVIALLGQPDAGSGSTEVNYMLGYNLIDCDSVRIQFGGDGRVFDVSYIQG